MQYDTPFNVIARPANPFVSELVGGRDAMRLLRLVTVRCALRPLQPEAAGGDWTGWRFDDSLRDALARLLQHGRRRLAGGGRRRPAVGQVDLQVRDQSRRPAARCGPEHGTETPCTICSRIWRRCPRRGPAPRPDPGRAGDLPGIAVPLGRVPGAPAAGLCARCMGVLGVLYTIPSVSLLVLLIPVLGLGFWPTIVALVIYCQAILVRNIVAGINEAWMRPSSRRHAGWA